jgi:hypothetical protein
MKKILLLASAVAMVVSTNAQDRSKAAYFDSKLDAKIDLDANNTLIKSSNIPAEKAASTVQVGSSYNCYTILGDRQNQVVYNPDINTVAFVHRQNNGLPGGSGIISLDYSTDGGATWTTNPFQTTPGMDAMTSNGNRYPNMGIYNPSANTNPANAYMLSVGPSLNTTFANNNGWAKTFRTSFKLDSSDLDETYDYNSVVGPNNDPNEWGAAGLYVTANGDAFYATTNWNNQGAAGSEDPNFDVPALYHDYFIHHGVWNGTNNNFDWTVDTITPNWYTTSGDGSVGGTQANVAGLPNMAWSPDGNTGYMVIMGADSNTNQNTMYRPYVMKTTDGGTTWNRHADFDFSSNTVFQCYTWGLNTNQSIQRPFFSSYDIVVDANNELRIFGEVNSGFSEHPDSLNYTFAARQAGFLFEVATNGSGWDVTFIDSVLVDDHVYDGTNNASHFVRPQASRSQDGTKLFYTWIGSDLLLSQEREFPDVWSIGHDVSGGMWTPITVLTTGTNANYVSAYQTMSVDVIENGTEKAYELPIVYGTDISGNALSDIAAPAQWHFLRGAGFDNSEFTVTRAANSCTVGIEEEVDAVRSTVFPNPTNGLFEIRLSDNTNFTYTIVDVLGNLVQTETIIGSNAVVDLSNNAKGAYFVNISTETSSVTHKVMLTK